MNVNDLMNKISDYSKKETKVKKRAEIEKYNRIDNLKDAIQEKGEKIGELIKLGNHALKNNIIVRYAGSDYMEKREYGYFFTDGWTHRLGFVWDYNQNKITHLGIEGGGAYKFNLKVNKEELEVTGDAEFILTKFIEELDKFEEDLVNYITKTVEKK